MLQEILHTKKRNIYQDPEYIAASIAILKDTIDDLARISAYNDDKYIDQIDALRKAVEAIK